MRERNGVSGSGARGPRDPPPLQNRNPLGIRRMVNGAYTEGAM